MAVSEVIIEGGTPQRANPQYMPNRSQEAPDLLPYLLPGEKIIGVIQAERQKRTSQPSSIQQLYRLARANSAESVGDNGPVIAATSFDEAESRNELKLFEAVFGRDSLRVAANLMDQYPKLAKATLLKLASLQGVEWNAEREEEPGRIPHEIRNPELDPVAKKLTQTRGWGWPYYGSVDATPQFLRVLTAYCRRVEGGIDILKESFIAKDGKKRTMADAMVAAVGWLQQRMAANPEGLVEYKSSIPGGIENQVWRDSWDAFFHADGTIANHQAGVASIDVQRVTYDTLLDVAELYKSHLHRPGEARLFKMQAAGLKDMIMNRFWTEEQGGFFVLGTDRDEKGSMRPLTVKTSDMGHVLHSQLLMDDDPEIVRRRETVIRQLFSPEMLAVGGIRTLGSDQIRFRPGAYHSGSVWLWDNYLIAQGLRLHGYDALAHELESRIVNDALATNEFPEYVRGGDEKIPTVTTRIVELWDETNKRINQVEQPPQEVQAWSVAAMLAISDGNEKRGLNQAKPTAFEAKILGQLQPIKLKSPKKD